MVGRALGAQGARGARRRACVGVRAGVAGSWASAAGSWARRRGAQWARRRGAQWARRRAEWHGRSGGARRQLGGSRVRGAQAAGRQATAPRVFSRGAAGARPGCWASGLAAGRAAWAWAVHSVHSAYFRSVFRLGIFPESLNEHYSL